MNLNFSNKNWIILSTAILIGLAYSIYFLVYVKNKEKDIISNNFRVLQQVVINIKSLEQSYLKNAYILSETTTGNEVNQNLEKLDKKQVDKMLKNQTDSVQQVLYTRQGLIFKVPYTEGTSGKIKYFFTPHEVFFNNELFQREDIFDQIIIVKVEEKDGQVSKREILFSNDVVGIMDTTFTQKKLRDAKDEITINDKRYVSFNQQIDDEQKIYISALILKSEFDQQKRSVSPFLIFTLSIALILIILAMPLLKLKVMSNEERLYIKDVVFSVVSVLLGPAVFMVFLYISFTYFGQEHSNTEAKLQSLSNKIEHNFQKEITRLVNQIDDFDSKFSSMLDTVELHNSRLFMPDTSLFDQYFTQSTLTINNHKQENILEEDFFVSHSNTDKIFGYRMYQDVIQKPEVKFKHLKAAFWSTGQAKALVMLSAFHQPSYAQDLKHRRYLTNIINRQPCIFHNVNGECEIAIESIKSVNDGSYEVGVGKASNSSTLPVLAISTKLASVMGTILEEGYGFCILNEAGETMFHSDIKKNMNENFINETQGTFAPAILSHTAMMATANYNGTAQSIYFRPLNSLSGHFIATFVEQELTNGPLTISMVSCFVLFLSYLVIILVVFMAMYYSNFKSSKLKQAVYLFNFLRPYETEQHYVKYKRLICVSSIVIVYLIGSAVVNYQHFDFLISELLIISISLLVFTFYALSRYMPQQKMMHSNIQDRPNTMYKTLVVAIELTMLLRIGYYVFWDWDFWLFINALLGFLVVLVIVWEVYSGREIFKFKYLDQVSDNPGQIQAVYKLYLFLWVIILSIIPVNIFLRITYEEERSIFAKYRSLELLEKIDQWEKTNRIEFANKFDADSVSHFQQFVASMRQDSIYLALIESKLSNEKMTGSSFVKDTSNSFFDSFYAYIRPNYNDRSSLSGKYIRNFSADSSWFFVQHNGQFFTSYFPNFNQPYVANTVMMAKTNFFMDKGLYVLLITIVSIIILLKFLGFAINKIYGFAYKQYASESGMDQKTFGEYFLNPQFFSNSSSYNNIFIVGVNASNTFHIKNYLKQHYQGHFLTLDFYDFDEETIQLEDESSKDIFTILRLDRLSSDWKAIIENAQASDKEMYVLIEHFEFGYNDLKMNKLKLQALKYIVDNKNFKVLISSEINATKLLDFYDDYVKRMTGWLKKAGADTRISQRLQLDDLKIDYKKWQHLLGSFVKCIVPINKFPHDEELAHGEYLDMISKYLGDRKSSDWSIDDKILSIQQMSYPYYFSVWNSLSKDERYIVYDIAKDKFLNTVNVNGILSLLDKGILIYDHSLRIMNESFANFVLTKVNSDEALEMEMESRKKGTWNTAFAVLFLLIISLVIFLSIGQHNFLNDLNAFLTGIAALIGLLIRFSGFLSFGGSKSAND